MVAGYNQQVNHAALLCGYGFSGCCTIVLLYFFGVVRGQAAAYSPR